MISFYFCEAKTELPATTIDWAWCFDTERDDFLKRYIKDER